MPTHKRSKTQGSPQAAEFAKAVLDRRCRTLLRAVGSLRRSPAGSKGAKAIHEVRVASRRASAAIRAFAALLGEKPARRAAKSLRALRKACGLTRDADVLLSWVRSEREAQPSARATGLDHLKRTLRTQQRRGKAQLLEDLPDLQRKLRKRVARLVPADAPTCDAPSIQDVAKAALEAKSNRVLSAAAANLQSPDAVHALRIACKRLRYGIELFEPILGKAEARALLEPLESFQEQVGAFTDTSVRIEALRREIASLKAPAAEESPEPAYRKAALADLQDLLRRQVTAQRSCQKLAVTSWHAIEQAGLIDALRRIVLRLGSEPPTDHAKSRKAPQLPESSQSRTSTRSHPDTPAGPREFAATNGHARPASANTSRHRDKRRLAAIDIGTNSIRLIIAEASPDGSYRVLDDEKEITRLGRGLHASGRLDPATQEHSAVTIARMVSIAAGYGVGELRVVATAACREAENGADFLRLVKQRSGVDIEVIGPEEEALLAYRSAANAFDLAGVPAAVVDIGGGSLEVVLSAGSGRGDLRGAGLGGGMIERVHSLPLGAVRLTEQFGGAERSSGKRFGELTRFIRTTLRAGIGKPPIVPQIVVGTGGTFTTLAAVLAHKEVGPGASGLLSGGVQGREVGRPDLRHLLERLRDMSVKDRAKIEGLPADRADIIVAGLAAIDELLGHLKANSVFIHEGGIRDGLLLSMVRGKASATPPRDASPLRAVKRFAKACNYEAAHAGHVTRLSLRLFDQLAAIASRLRPRGQDPGTSFGPRDRLLLESAALLHDVGYLINYSSHHKHSYHLIVHAELPGLTSREVQVVANVARYHRASEPKPQHRNFATLSQADQQLVRALAAILRIADGLDRTHMQQVSDIDLRIEKRRAVVRVSAPSEPAVDLWGAARKARLFERVFGLALDLEWHAGAPTPTEASALATPVPTSELPPE